MSVNTAIPVHIPVLLRETIEVLQVKPGGHYIDCTVGSGGHALAILEKSSPHGRLLGIDADPQAIEMAQLRLRHYSSNVLLINDNFANLETVCTTYKFHPAQGILFDLGVSSPQLAQSNRGFSFQQDGPLDMRFDPRQKLTATDIVNSFPEDELVRLIQLYGEERFSRRIARYIVENRPLATTLELARIVEQVVSRKRGRIHPATRTFQSLRIVVNRELENLELALKQAIRLLDVGGRLAVISYHSLEDRLVKEFFKREATGCLCPPGTPSCICRHVSTLSLITKKVIIPSASEVEFNPRSRSAKLRVVQRV